MRGSSSSTSFLYDRKFHFLSYKKDAPLRMRTRAELRQGGRYGFKTEGSIYLCPQLLTQPDERFLQTIRTAEHKDLESEKTVAVKRNSSSPGF